MSTWEEGELDTELSRGFSAGNFANAYETQDYGRALDALGDVSPAYRDAFTLGFFASYELHEMGECREAFEDAYFSDFGKRVVELGYCDAREPEEFERD